jgi:hypothetical protein
MEYGYGYVKADYNLLTLAELGVAGVNLDSRVQQGKRMLRILLNLHHY